MVEAYVKEIIRSYLVASAHQMTARLIRCAYSYTVREMEDCSAGILGHKESWWLNPPTCPST